MALVILIAVIIIIIFLYLRFYSKYFILDTCKIGLITQRYIKADIVRYLHYNYVLMSLKGYPLLKVILHW